MLHLGDFDPSGESVFESMYGDVLAFTLGDLSETVGLPRTAFYGGQEHLFEHGGNGVLFGIYDVAQMRRLMLRPEQIPSPNGKCEHNRDLLTRAVNLNNRGEPKPYSKKLDTTTKR